VELDARAEIAVAHDRVVAALEDLATYPHWLTIVGAAAAAPAHPDDGERPAWWVDLVGRVGPFRRTKRVRMVRTALDRTTGTVRFERVEHDGRTHNAWILTAEARAAAGGRTTVHVHLHYGGGRTLPGADLLLRQEAGKAGVRLERHLRSLE
jgi:hypothetical protein